MHLVASIRWRTISIEVIRVSTVPAIDRSGLLLNCIEFHVSLLVYVQWSWQIVVMSGTLVSEFIFLRASPADILRPATPRMVRLRKGSKGFVPKYLHEMAAD
jgi:hypothetical protein